jgi:hypothetical protein
VCSLTTGLDVETGRGAISLSEQAIHQRCAKGAFALPLL